MFLLLLIYPTAYLVMWAFLWFTPIGAILSATLFFTSYRNKQVIVSDSVRFKMVSSI